MGGPDRPSPTRGPLRRWAQAAGELAVVGGVADRRKLCSAVPGVQQHAGIPLIRGRAEPLGGHRPEGHPAKTWWLQVSGRRLALGRGDARKRQRLWSPWRLCWPNAAEARRQEERRE